MNQRKEEEKKIMSGYCFPYPCFSDGSLTVIERSVGPVVIDGKQFLGLSVVGNVGTFDTPLYDATNERLVGRLIGSFQALEQKDGRNIVAVGTWNFYCFNNNSWVTCSTGFDNSGTNRTDIPNVILNGTRKYLGAKGILEQQVIKEGDCGYNPAVFQIRWTLRFQ